MFCTIENEIQAENGCFVPGTKKEVVGTRLQELTRKKLSKKGLFVPGNQNQGNEIVIDTSIHFLFL